MPDLAGVTTVPTPELPSDDESAADPGSDADVDQVSHVAAGTVVQLADGAVVGVVVRDHRQAIEEAGQHLADPHACPARRRRSSIDGATFIHRAGDADRQPDHASGRDTEAVDHRANAIGDHDQDRLTVRAGDEGLVVLGEHGAPEVRDADLQAFTVDRHADGRARAGHQRDSYRRPAGQAVACSRVLAFLDDAPFLE